MKKVLMLVAMASLLVLLAGAFAFAGGRLSEPANKQLMLAASLVWFILAPFWMTSRAT